MPHLKHVQEIKIYKIFRNIKRHPNSLLYGITWRDKADAWKIKNNLLLMVWKYFVNDLCKKTWMHKRTMATISCSFLVASLLWMVSLVSCFLRMVWPSASWTLKCWTFWASSSRPEWSCWAVTPVWLELSWQRRAEIDSCRCSNTF